MEQKPGGVLSCVFLRHERGLQSSSYPRIPTLRRKSLIGYQLRLHNETNLGINRLNLVVNGHDSPLGERDQASRGDLDGTARRRSPADVTAQHAIAKIKFSLVTPDGAIPDIKGFIVDKEANDLAISNVDDRLPGFRVGIAALCVRQRTQFVERIQVGTGKAVRHPLIQIAAQSNMSVGKSEN